MLAKVSKDRMRWAAFFVIHSMDFLKELEHGGRRGDVAARCRRDKKRVFNVKTG